MPKAKQGDPPQDDPIQSERFMKDDAAELAAEDGATLFESAMGALAKPSKLPSGKATPIIRARVKKSPVREKSKSGSTE